ncbi:HEXXH motif domain-containing protein [Saccharopolyspora sp. K220]|uniref:HEXXH motif domain-containing protein n=1 Tax=Saccharopolyspora soli TaxID=2926618 RepID=UPI001F569815|nr:HEXXH motif domain-containing protein [Saccharopolyspora soli]MCI2415859.1 HEXXH motif domain-containing protein [Saccharopolyspora soli]
MPVGRDSVPEDVALHRLSWADFDDLARGSGGARTVRRLRRAERSRRLLLLRALVDEVAKVPDLRGPLPSPESSWELLTRVQAKAPRVLDLMLAHPYTGSWAGYTTRLFHHQTTGVCPLWVHIGHIHALAAAAAIRAGLRFETSVPVWHGGAILPTIGLARLPAQARFSVADVHGESGRLEIRSGTACVRIPPDHSMDAPGWWGIRHISVRAHGQALAVRLDDIDPYRGLYEPVLPQRISTTEMDTWRGLLKDAWRLIVQHLPEIADALSAGLNSLVPRPAIPFREPSASTGEAFGSAIVSRPADAVALAAMLVHEFQHIRLGGLLHLTRLREEDPRERFYAPWRDDPRPMAGMLQGTYAFFGVTMFWRALAHADPGFSDRRAVFEFAYWRAVTWGALQVLRDDPVLTQAGRRFVDGIAERLGPWQDEPIPADLADMAAALASDHYAGWRIRYVRPIPETVAAVADAWLAGRRRLAGIRVVSDRTPTPVPDGPWSRARTDLVRLGLGESAPSAPADSHGQHMPSEVWSTVPDATPADFAYASGRLTDAVVGYQAELAADPDRPASWVGLGLALSGLGARPAARALLTCPELVRAVHRRVRTGAASVTAPDELADWIGRFLT